LIILNNKLAVNNWIFFRSETVGAFKNGLPAFRSNVAPTLQNANTSGNITTAIGAKLLASLILKSNPNIKPPCYKIGLYGGARFEL